MELSKSIGREFFIQLNHYAGTLSNLSFPPQIESQSLQFPFSFYTHILARWLVVMFQEIPSSQSFTDELPVLTQIPLFLLLYLPSGLNKDE